MSGSKSRPALQPLDLSPAVATDATRPPRTDPNDARFAGAEQFETPEAVARAVMNGSVRTLNPETMPRQPDAGMASTRRRTPETSLSTKVPEYVMKQLRQRHVDTNITIRNQILLALRQQGFEIDDADIQDERKWRHR